MEPENAFLLWSRSYCQHAGAEYSLVSMFVFCNHYSCQWEIFCLYDGRNENGWLAPRSPNDLTKGISSSLHVLLVRRLIFRPNLPWTSSCSQYLKHAFPGQIRYGRSPSVLSICDDGLICSGADVCGQ